MKNTALNDQTEYSKLKLAQALELPSREAMLHRAPSVSKFWSQNKHLLIDAWGEWEEQQRNQRLIPDDALLDSTLRDTV